MPIVAGDMLPDVTLMTMTAEGQIEISSADFFAGKKAILFGVPGAFTPTCHKQHLPGFMAKEDELRAKGVDVIACLSVNDAHVMDAWKKQTGAGRGITFLADGNGDFTRAIGMQYDASATGKGERSKRYAMIIDDGRVSVLHEESKTGEAIASGAERMLSEL